MTPSDERPEEMPGEEDGGGTPTVGASPGYALGQLAAAFAASQEHADPGVRTRAARKARDWVKVFRGMLSGDLRVGSRTPVSGAPAWATPRVVRAFSPVGAEATSSRRPTWRRWRR